MRKQRIDCTSGRARIIFERVTKSAYPRVVAKSRAISRELLQERRRMRCARFNNSVQARRRINQCQIRRPITLSI